MPLKLVFVGAYNRPSCSVVSSLHRVSFRAHVPPLSPPPPPLNPRQTDSPPKADKELLKKLCAKPVAELKRRKKAESESQQLRRIVSWTPAEVKKCLPQIKGCVIMRYQELRKWKVYYPGVQPASHTKTWGALLSENGAACSGLGSTMRSFMASLAHGTYRVWLKPAPPLLNRQGVQEPR